MKGEYISIETARITADIEKENKMLIEALEINHKIIDKYEERINKAIEYIKEDMCVEPKELYGLVDGEHLLNILQGEDKE